MSNAKNAYAIISKSKNVFWIFFCISKIYIKFEILLIIKWSSEVICFWNYRLQKSGLLKCRKSPVSEHLRKANMLKGRKHCLNMHKSIFVIFLCTLKGYQVEKLCFSCSWNFDIVCWHIDPEDKYSLSVKAGV